MTGEGKPLDALDLSVSAHILTSTRNGSNGRGFRRYDYYWRACSSSRPYSSQGDHWRFRTFVRLALQARGELFPFDRLMQSRERRCRPARRVEHNRLTRCFPHSLARSAVCSARQVGSWCRSCCARPQSLRCPWSLRLLRVARLAQHPGRELLSRTRSSRALQLTRALLAL